MMPIFRLRLRFFKTHSAALYNRYTDFSLLFLFLFGQIVIEAPTLVAQPLLVFFTHPLDLQHIFLPLLIWFALVAVWAKIQ